MRYVSKCDSTYVRFVDVSNCRRWCDVRCEEMSSQASTAESDADRLDMLEQCASLFARLQGDYYEEYHVHELSTLAVAVVYPLVSHCHQAVLIHYIYVLFLLVCVS